MGIIPKNDNVFVEERSLEIQDKFMSQKMTVYRLLCDSKNFKTGQNVIINFENILYENVKGKFFKESDILALVEI